MAAPLRKVIKGRWRVCQSILINSRSRWWDLELECGHFVERRVLYRRADPAKGEQPTTPGWKGPGARSINPARIKPHPKRVRCEDCARIKRSG